MNNSFLYAKTYHLIAQNIQSILWIKGEIGYVFDRQVPLRHRVTSLIDRLVGWTVCHQCLAIS